MIEREAGTVVVGEADDGEQALALIEQCHPDVAILDVEMPQMSGFEVARAIVAIGLVMVCSGMA